MYPKLNNVRNVSFLSSLWLFVCSYIYFVTSFWVFKLFQVCLFVFCEYLCISSAKRFKMENSISLTEGHQSFRSPPRRRRSTFFERRNSIVPQALSENVDPDVCKMSSETTEKHAQDLKKYYDKLLAEKEQWKREVNNRRNKYHDLRQQYQMAAKAPSRSRITYSALSNEDIEFLKAKPNLSKLVESQQKLHKSVKEALALYRRANELDNVILGFCEEKVNKITEHILEHSTVEPMVL